MSKFHGFHKLSSQPTDDKITLKFNYIKSIYPILYEIEQIRIDKRTECEIFNIEISEIVYNFYIDPIDFKKDIGTTHPEEVKRLIQNFIL